MKTNQDVLLIVAVAFVLRISFVGLLHVRGYTSDENEYLSLATKLSEGKEFVDSNGEWSTKAPLWPFVLSVLFRVVGSGLLVPHLLGCLLGAFAVYLVFRLCVELLEDRFVALIAASLLAVYPSLIVYSDILQSEAMYIVFVLIAFLFLERTRSKPTMLNAALLGVFAAGATLTRAVFFGFFIFLLLFGAWMFREKYQRYGTKLLMSAGVWVILLAPWTIRNYNVHSTFVPISSWGGMSLLLGNNPYSTGTWSTKPGFEEWFATKAKENGIDLAHSTEIQRSALGRKVALEFITSEPVDAAKLALKKFYIHWIYPISNSDSNTRLQAICVAGDVLLYMLGGIGLIVIGEKRRSFLPIFAAIVFFTALQVIMHCEARYRLPIMPFVAMLSAIGASVLIDTRRLKEFWQIQKYKVAIASWVVAVCCVYAFTAWQFLSGKI